MVWKYGVVLGSCWSNLQLLDLREGYGRVNERNLICEYFEEMNNDI